MRKLYSKILVSLIASLGLFCGCGEVDDAPPTYSQKCGDVAEFEGFQASFGSYKEGKTIPFKHSDGYLFSLTVVSKDKYIEETSCLRCMYTLLESAYPIYSISVSAVAPSFYFDEKDKLNRDAVDVRFGQYLFTLKNPIALGESDSSYIDTLEVNGVTYTGVAVSNGVLQNGSQGKSVPTDAKLYYQEKKGILKIELEDGSYIAINEED
ncbi:hypothetical protein [Fibrobacter sp.]|uniref:hypothetical protein n=1 Tax=Fibrobacter sp. TaxID=35828 RepID=UPI00386BF69F